VTSDDETKPRIGRPSLGFDEIERRVAAYCRRYGVAVAANGLPPFPSGRRETRQHREWHTLYRAHQRHERRTPDGTPKDRTPGRRPSAASESTGACAVCRMALDDAAAASFARRGSGKAAAVRVHGACADLARAAEAAGPDAVAGVAKLLWPERRFPKQGPFPTEG
jgi:hypothetical protein